MTRKSLPLFYPTFFLSQDFVFPNPAYTLSRTWKNLKLFQFILTTQKGKRHIKHFVLYTLFSTNVVKNKCCTWRKNVSFLGYLFPKRICSQGVFRAKIIKACVFDKWSSQRTVEHLQKWSHVVTLNKTNII